MSILKLKFKKIVLNLNLQKKYSDYAIMNG